LPRPILIAAAQAGMALGHVLLAIDCPGSLYIGSLLVGLGYGSHWSVIPATASELFGLKSFGILYNVLCVANPVGSLVFSGLIAGTLYDREAQKQRGLNILANSVANHQLATTVDDALLCEGAICFQETLFIMTGACLLGIVLNLVLVARTRPVYITLYGKQREEDRRADIQKLKGPSSVQKG
jgi:MFS family permease